MGSEKSEMALGTYNPEISELPRITTGGGDSRGDRALIEEWEKERKKALEGVRQEYARMERRILYYAGVQWLQMVDGKLEQIDKNALWSVQLTVNIYARFVNAWRSRIMIDRPIPLAVAKNTTDEAVMAAKLGEKLLQHLDGKQKAPLKNQAAVLAYLLCGVAFWKTFWDEDQSSWVKVGEGLYEEKKTGDIVSPLVLPLETAWDPTVDEFADAGWWYHSNWENIETAHRRFPESKEILKSEAPNEEDREAEGLRRILRSMIKRFLQRGRPEASDDSKQVLAHERYERLDSGDDNPQYRVVTYANGIVLQEDFLMHNPWTAIHCDKLPGVLWPVTPAEDMIPLQDEYNKAKSRLAEHHQLFVHPKVLRHKGASIPDDAFTNEPGEQIEWTGTEHPSYLQPPALNPEAYRYPQTIIQDMQELAGVHEVSRAQVPAGVKSGVAIQALQAQDTTNLQVMSTNWKEGSREKWEKTIKLAALHYDAPRILHVMGKGHEPEYEEVMGKMLLGIAEIRLQTGSGLPLDKMARQEMVMKMVETGVFANPELMKIVMKLLDLENIQFEVDEAQQHYWLARREIREIEAGGHPVVRQGQDHDVHIASHMRYENSPEYMDWPVEFREELTSHNNRHRAAMLREAAEQTAQQAVVGNPEIALAFLSGIHPGEHIGQPPPGATPEGVPADEGAIPQEAV